MKKKNTVVFIDEELKASFDKLKSGKFEDKQLYKAILKAVEELKENPLKGIKIPKKLWPKEYITKYGIKNLWKFNLRDGWRLIYTIKADSVEIITAILEWFDHKNYEKKFKY